MLFYRIEHQETRTGPYCHDAMNEVVHVVHKHNEAEGGVYALDPRDHKGPIEDGGELEAFWKSTNKFTEIHRREGYRFGFVSREDAHWWWVGSTIPEVVKILENHGFVLNVYEVPEAFTGNTQAIAKLDGLTPIETIKPREMLTWDIG